MKRQAEGHSAAGRRRIDAELRRRNVNWNLNHKPPKLKGDETRALFEVWETTIAAELGLEGTPGDVAMRGMHALLQGLYRTEYDASPSADCAKVARYFRTHCCVNRGGGPNYLYILEHDIPRLADMLHGLGMGLGMFSQDIAESLNRLLKDYFINYTARGGGGDGGPAGLEGKLRALRQAWERLFLEFDLPLYVNGEVKRGKRCRNRDAWRGDDSESEDGGYGGYSSSDSECPGRAFPADPILAIL